MLKNQTKFDFIGIEIQNCKRNETSNLMKIRVIIYIHVYVMYMYSTVIQKCTCSVINH